MADGKSHSSASIGLATGLLCGYGAAYYIDPKYIPAISVGALLGIVLTPDLDVDHGNIGFWYIRNVFGTWAERYWKKWTEPYALALRHRSFLSHAPIISTIVRLTYLAFPIIMLGEKTSFRYITKVFLAQIAALPIICGYFYLIHYDYMVMVSCVIGLILSDILHAIFDAIF